MRFAVKILIEIMITGSIFAVLFFLVKKPVPPAPPEYSEIMPYKVVCKNGFMKYHVKTGSHGGGFAPYLNKNNEEVRCD